MNKTELRPKRVAIIGAGPAGLTAAYSLLKKSKEAEVTVLEADPEYVGGISRTVKYKGFRFDIGGHRFFSKSKEVEDFWTEILPNDMLNRPRSSRIFYRGKFFSYPLKAFEALFKLGVAESVLCMLSYSKAQVMPVRDPKNFEDWVSNKFGKRLFSIFFKTYTEKVWGMNCKDISADWAAQRIKGLSLASAIKNAVLPKRKPKNRGEVIKTLIDTFRYPRLGPGMMWEVCAEKIKAMGGNVLMGRKVTGCHWNNDEKIWTVTSRDADGNESKIQAEHVISSAPLRELGMSLTPKLPQAAVEAAGSLKYRDFVTVALIIKDREQFSDNWIYIHDPNVKVGRVQNFKSWSPELVPDPAFCCYGLEYFCFKDDGLWSSSDENLIELAKSEIEKIGLAKPTDVVDGCVVRQAKAYPIYDDEYAAHVTTLRTEIERHFPTMHMVGRNGMHKYNNQDHAMMTAMLCAENILADERIYDVWQVNEDADYHEEGNAGEQSSVSGLRSVPKQVLSS
ncbi:MAG: NAD(P)/FAD-dependent oxidoreductase [Acidobacteria bacterium]|nr:NAD(P)/FAD-dependent oxidoreductase [Acidobacteriota bacterium]